MFFYTSFGSSSGPPFESAAFRPKFVHVGLLILGIVFLIGAKVHPAKGPPAEKEIFGRPVSNPEGRPRRLDEARVTAAPPGRKKEEFRCASW
jgi:hypothetical protein